MGKQEKKKITPRVISAPRCIATLLKNFDCRLRFCKYVVKRWDSCVFLLRDHNHIRRTLNGVFLCVHRFSHKIRHVLYSSWPDWGLTVHFDKQPIVVNRKKQGNHRLPVWGHYMPREPMWEDRGRPVLSSSFPSVQPRNTSAAPGAS